MIHHVKTIFMYLMGLYLIVSVGSALILWVLTIKEWIERNISNEHR